MREDKLEEVLKGQSYYIRENQKEISSLKEEIEKLISALSSRVDKLEKLISSLKDNLPPLELVHHEGKWMTLDDFLKSRGNG